jgi:hypothetical protein
MLTMLAIVSVMALPAFAATVAPFTLSASASSIQFNLPAGTVFNGSVSTTGTVRVWVNGPNGAQTANLGLVDESATFGFVAQQSGNYTVNFENDLQAPVEVTFSYQTNPEIIDSSPQQLPLDLLAIPIVIAAVGSVVIFIVIRRKSRKTRPVQ